VLGDDSGALSKYTEFTSCKFIKEMCEAVIVELFSRNVLYRHLEFALYFAHEEVVDEDVVVTRVQFVFDSY